MNSPASSSPPLALAGASIEPRPIARVSTSPSSTTRVSNIIVGSHRRRITRICSTNNNNKLSIVTVFISSLAALLSMKSGVIGIDRVGPILWRGIFGRACSSHYSTTHTTIKRRGFAVGAFVSALLSPPTSSRAKNDQNNMSSNNMQPDSCIASDGNNNEECTSSSSLLPTRMIHPKDPNLWLYHVESTTSTMDEAKRLVENKFTDHKQHHTESKSETSKPNTFLISASSQSNGRGTTQRNWKSAQRGNALFTIGIQQSSWMMGLKSINSGKMVPLTLLPLKVGSLVAFRVKEYLEGCADVRDNDNGDIAEKRIMPRVTVKWPNDVLLHIHPSDPQQPQSHEKIAGILIESSQDWFLIGIGINVGYAPDIPKEGVDYGRQATCLSRYCNAKSNVENSNGGDGSADEEEYWIQVSKQLARDIAHDISSWLNQPVSSQFDLGGTILNEWKSFVDWDMELILRDTAERERVTLTSVMEDGRVVVRVRDTGEIRTLVADYFL